MTRRDTIMMAKILEPETATPETLGGVRVEIPRTDVNVVDAAARGTTDGLHLMLNVIAMLVSFIALVALANGAFGWVHRYVAWFPENIQTVHPPERAVREGKDRKSTRLNSSHVSISYAVFCLKKKKYITDE